MKKVFVWLKEVDSIAIQSSVRNLTDAYTRFFKKQTSAPRFKSKKNNVQSYTTKQTNENIAIEEKKIKLPKLGLVRFAKSREVKRRIVNAMVRRNLLNVLIGSFFLGKNFKYRVILQIVCVFIQIL